MTVQPSPERAAYFAHVKQMIQSARYVELLTEEGAMINSEEFKRGAFKRESFGNYVPTTSDVIVSTYPKSGTNWTMQIAQEIAWRGEAEFDFIHDVIPWPDATVKTAVAPLEDSAQAYQSPTGYRIIKSHLDAEYIPYNEDAKYIIVVRDPKEVLVSAFHFENGFFEKMVGAGVPLAAYVDGFLRGEFVYSPWAGHTAGWWVLRQKANVLILFYHEMKQNPSAAIQRVAGFLDVALTDAQFAAVAEKSSYAYMKAHNHKFSPPAPPDYPVQGKIEMVRSGQSGAAPHELTTTQQTAIDTFCMAELERLESDFPYGEVFMHR